MKYMRPPYMAKGVPVKEYSSPFGGGKMTIPCPDYPIGIRENFKRAYTRDNPVWVPNSMTDFTSTMLANLTGAGEADWSAKEAYDWQDWFGVQWTFVPVAGGPMLKPGTQYLDDITKWRERVKWPNLDDYDIKGLCEKFMADKYDWDKVLHVNIGQGCTERLVAIMGGYTDAMLALAEEPNAVVDFLNAFVDFTIKVFDKIYQYLPIDMVTYHDDWGTERDTFFSPKMMNDIVFKPTKRLFDHIKSNGICIELHSCGKVERFLPYMIELGTDFLQLQERANDLKMLKEKYGDRIGFNVRPMPKEPGKEARDEAIHNLVDTFGKGGGLYTGLMERDPEVLWDAVMEMYYYSREYYEK